MDSSESRVSKASGLYTGTSGLDSPYQLAQLLVWSPALFDGRTKAKRQFEKFYFTYQQ